MHHVKQTQQIQQANVTSMSHDGRGIAHINGKTTFIDGALPNETVTFIYTKKHKTFDEGRIVEIISASPDRVTPLCPHYGVCGGCSLQHLSSTAQITYKQKMVTEQLKHFGNTQPEKWLPPLTDSAWHYRRRARLGVRYVKKKNKLIIGFREKNSSYLTDSNECKVLIEPISKLIPALRELISQLSCFEHIPQIEVAGSDTEIAFIIRHLVAFTPEDLTKIKLFGQTHNIRLYLQPGGEETIHLFYPENVSPFLHYSFKKYGIDIAFSPNDFVQIHAGINQKLCELALNLMELNADDVVLDLFCGLGNFSLAMAKHCMEVIGVEGSEAMVQRARQNAHNNHIPNVQFFAANLEESFVTASWFSQKVTKILIDPPRSGAAGVMEQLPRLAAKRIIYISCNPATLARDAGILVHQLGYRFKQAGVIDMFPHTSHVESIAVFER